MGSANHSCGCGHPASHHIPLLACTKNDCLCDRFTSTDAIPQCYNCLHSPVEHQIEQRGDIEFNQLKVWVAQGISQTDMTHLYSKKFGHTISLRSLQRRLSDFCLRVTDRNVTDDQIMTSIRLEVGNGVRGYQTMHKVLRSKYGLLVSRDRVHYLMRSNDDIPKGNDPKIDGKRYHTKPFISEGPNWLLALDGHEKLVQPLGTNLYIYGIIDTFSRKVLALSVLPNKKKSTIANWLITELNAIKEIVKRAYVLIEYGVDERPFMFFTMTGQGLVSIPVENYITITDTQPRSTTDMGSQTEDWPALPIHYQPPPPPPSFNQIPPPYMVNDATRPGLPCPVPRPPFPGKFDFTPTRPHAPLNFSQPPPQLPVPAFPYMIPPPLPPNNAYQPYLNDYTYQPIRFPFRPPPPPQSPSTNVGDVSDPNQDHSDLMSVVFSPDEYNLIQQVLDEAEGLNTTG